MKYFYILCALILNIACTNHNVPKMIKKEKENDKLIVYQIFTRLFGNTNTTNKFNGTLQENGSGKFDDITEKALAELKNFGVTHVWYTGVIEHATMSDFSTFGIKKDNPLIIKGIAGSPYAIKDYYDVNPALATDVSERMQEFENLIERSHKLGLKVIIDFVPNHVSRAYKSDAKPENAVDFGENDDTSKAFKPSNNYYYLTGKSFIPPKGISVPIKVDSDFIENPAKATGNDVFSEAPSIYDWYETIKLNYGVDYLNNRTKHFDPIPDTWNKMYEILSFWQKKGVDGFRCDMAEMVPVEFWGWVIPKIKQNKNTAFIAEIYNPSAYNNYLQNGKFDYLYDKVGLYDALRRLMEGGGNANDITKVWQNESGDFSNKMLRFLENHDEQRIASSYFAGDMSIGKPAMALSATLHGGPLMYYFGQEFGVNPTEAEGFQGNDGRTTIFDYWGVPEYQAWVNEGKFDGGKLNQGQKDLYTFYKNLNTFVTNNEAITVGNFWDLQYVNQNPENYDTTKVYSYVRYTQSQRLLFVFNFDLENDKTIALNLADDLLKELKLRKAGIKLSEVFTGKEKIELSENGSEFNIKLAKNNFRVFEIN